MRGRVVLGAAGAAMLVLSLAVSGTDPLARLALQAGMPRLAAGLAKDPGLRGAALYRAGAFDQAAAAFAAAGDGYNHGLAATWAGDYATALVVWEQHMAKAPGDGEARANHTLVRALLAGVRFDDIARPPDRDSDGPEMAAEAGQGKARAASTGDDANDSKTGFWMPEVTGEGLRRVPKIFDAQFLAANRRWLETMEDQPGAYLRARLAAEQKARAAAGTALPEPEDPR